jgi:molybdopterin converting factor small subunit
MSKTEFEVTGDENALRRLKEKFLTSIKVTEHWGSDNWNVVVSNDVVHEFEDWCDDNDVVARIL